MRTPRFRIDPKANIFWTLRDLKIPFVQEHIFSKKRMFRFDFALLEHKIAIEYEGIYATPRGKSRHTTMSGYSEDSTKYNLATVEGWRILRYTAKNYMEFRQDLTQLLCLKQ